jgi:uncharacterized protein
MTAVEKKQKSIVIKPVGAFCNLNCDYCFYLEKRRLYGGAPSSHRMTDETVEKVIADMFACSDAPTFVWHGGEPTLAGIEFFVKVVATQRFYARGRPYSNAIQTNGTLLNDEWAHFFKNENFLVGISLDGPEKIHNLYRKDRGGKGTFDRVFQKAKMLLEKGVQVNALAVINDCSAKFPKKIYRFFKKNGFNFMQFIPVAETDPQNPEHAAPYSAGARDYGMFLDKLFKLWIKDFDFEKLRQKTSIRFFDSLLQVYIGMEAAHCIFRKECGDAITVEHNGDMFPCDYLVSNDTRIGNLNEMSLADVFNSKSLSRFGALKANIDAECNACKWLNLCYGGCIKDRMRDPQDRGKNHFCLSYKYFFEKTDKPLKQLAAMYKKYYL